MKPHQHKCQLCGEPLRADGAFFFVSAGSRDTVTGRFCSVRHYIEAQYGAARAQEASERAFIPRNGWGDADTLMQEEGIVR